MQGVILIYSKQRDQFVNNVIDWLGTIPFIRISKGNGFVYNLASLDNTSASKFSFRNDYIKESYCNDIVSAWYNGGNTEYVEKENSNELNSYFSKDINLIIEGICSSAKSIGSKKNNYPGNKIQNLFIARDVGFNIPETLITKDKNELFVFFETYKSEGVISKKINESDFFIEDNYLFDISKTISIKETDLKNIPDTFGLSFFQKRIQKQFEIRIIYFNDTFYSCAIFDDSNNVDYRIHLRNNTNKPRIVPYNLPENIKTKLRTLLAKVNYTTASIDLIYSNKGEYIFLEINPCGQISYINSACNFYLEELFANFLKTRYEKNKVSLNY